MSEDDADIGQPDGHDVPGKVVDRDRDRRPPRFSWTPAYEATLFRSLCESVQLGLRENNSFKAEAWERAAQALAECHGASPTKSHLINKSDNARKRFRLWRGLREDPDFVYNSTARTVTATEETWRAHIEREPLSRALRGRPFDHQDYMETLFPDVIGSGGAPKRVTKPRRRDGQLGDEPELVVGVNSSLLSAEQTAAGPSSLEDSSSGVLSALNTSLPTGTSPGSGSTLMHPENNLVVSRKRGLVDTDTDALLSATNPCLQVDPPQPDSPEKRIRL